MSRTVPRNRNPVSKAKTSAKPSHANRRLSLRSAPLELSLELISPMTWTVTIAAFRIAETYTPDTLRYLLSAFSLLSFNLTTMRNMEAELGASIQRHRNCDRGSTSVGISAVANRTSNDSLLVGVYGGDRLADEAAAILHPIVNSKWGFRCNWA